LRPTERRALARLLAGVALLALIAYVLPRLDNLPLSDRFQTFATIFLGIFIEAVPFLLAGSVVSGAIEVFVDQESLARLIPRRALPAAITGAVLGLAFPVCECGVVPVTRRLYAKGMPVSVGVAFLLAAPVVNPIVILSTYAAFGWGPVLVGRLGFTVLIAVIVGLLFSAGRPADVLRPESLASPGGHSHASAPPAAGVRPRLRQALAVGADDFLDMARFLIIGSLLAAGMQTLVPQSALLALGQGPVISVVALMALAFVLSICSTVDAFVALSFANTFTTGAILGFLVFGPMVDIKSALMFSRVFRRRPVGYLVLLPLLMTLAIALFVNLRLGW
jgi:uncharacterized membrane protein YraQ (UPF0718 family)